VIRAGALRTAVLITWAGFWAYWLIAAFRAKHDARPRRFRPIAVLIVAAGAVLIRLSVPHSLAVRSGVVQVLGLLCLAAGLAIAVWARHHLGRNWGMPMTVTSEPELVTSGPYRAVRHPIYSGLLLAAVGTAMCTTVSALSVAVVVAAYFIYSARVEEGLLAEALPSEYASYRARTKMLIPFVF
jgi:protein-S-isoprenylcysteine O-methyltransferase Ste14